MVVKLTRRAYAGGGLAIAASGGMPRVPAFAGCVPERSRLALRGVSLSGAEFGERMPGVYGQDYIYPGADDISAVARLGFNSVRLPFRWERLAPELSGDFSGEEWRRLAETVDFAERAGLRVILDVHNYAGRKVVADGYSAEHKIGSRMVPAAAFVDFWGGLATRCNAWPNLVFGLMNEPFGIAPEAWLSIANGAIARIRAVGSRHLILVPGVAYTGAHSWHASGNGAMAGIIDPQDNFAIEVHQYLDADSSGTRAQVVSTTIGAERIEAFQEWARGRGLRAYLGEFAAGSDALGRSAIIDLVAEIERNPDVWIGWAAWAAGPWWPSDYIFRIDGSGVPNLYTRTLSELARGKVTCEASR